MHIFALKHKKISHNSTFLQHFCNNCLFPYKIRIDLSSKYCKFIIEKLVQICFIQKITIEILNYKKWWFGMNSVLAFCLGILLGVLIGAIAGIAGAIAGLRVLHLMKLKRINDKRKQK